MYTPQSNLNIKKDYSVRIETLLNKVYKLKSFVQEPVEIKQIGKNEALVVTIRARKNRQSVVQYALKMFEHIF